MTTMTKARMPARTASKTVHAYREAGIEPTISEMLSEPIVRAVMRRDSVSDEVIIRVIADARAQRADRRIRCLA